MPPYLSALMFIVGSTYFIGLLKQPKFSETHPFPSGSSNSKDILNRCYVYVYKHLYSDDYLILPERPQHENHNGNSNSTKLTNCSTIFFSHVFCFTSIKCGIYPFAWRCFTIKLRIYFAWFSLSVFYFKIKMSI